MCFFSQVSVKHIKSWFWSFKIPSIKGTLDLVVCGLRPAMFIKENVLRGCLTAGCVSTFGLSVLELASCGVDCSAVGIDFD